MFFQGWEYSAFMFIAINAASLAFIFWAYVRMFGTIRSSAVAVRSTQRRDDRALAQRFAIIVATDCLCWLPVILVKLLALFGKYFFLFSWFRVSNFSSQWFIFVKSIFHLIKWFIHLEKKNKIKILTPLSLFHYFVLYVNHFFNLFYSILFHLYFTQFLEVFPIWYK